MNRSIKTLAIVSFLAVMISGCSSEKTTFTINGSIDMENGTIYLQKFRNKMFFVIDSATIENGGFKFSGNLAQSDLFGLTIHPEEPFATWFVFLDPGEIAVEIETMERRSIVIKGSESHDLYESYLANRQNFDIDSFIVAHPASVVPTYVLYRDFITRLSADDLQRSISGIDPSLNELQYVQEVKSVIAKRQQVRVGNPAPDFTSSSPEGTPVSLSDFRDNYLILQFWASWCGPCRRSNPGYVSIFNTFNDKGVNIFSVSLDNNKESWIRAIENDQLTWAHASDLKFWDSEPASLYGVRNIPSNVLIDPDGIILGINLSHADLEARLGQLLLN